MKTSDMITCHWIRAAGRITDQNNWQLLPQVLKSLLHRLWTSYSHVLKSCLKLAVIAVLSGGLAGSSSLLLTPTSNALGLTPLTFCHHTGTINTNLLLAALSTALNLGLVISSRQQVLFWMSTRQENGKWSCCRSDRDYWSNGHWPIRAKGWARVRR